MQAHAYALGEKDPTPEKKMTKTKSLTKTLSVNPIAEEGDDFRTHVAKLFCRNRFSGPEALKLFKAAKRSSTVGIDDLAKTKSLDEALETLVKITTSTIGAERGTIFVGYNSMNYDNILLQNN